MNNTQIISKIFIIISILNCFLSFSMESGKKENVLEKTVTKFYVVKPGFNWCPRYPKVIIEAESQTVYVHPGYQTRLSIKAPMRFKERYPFVLESSFIQCEGPVRELSDEEYIDVIFNTKKTEVKKKWLNKVDSF